MATKKKRRPLSKAQRQQLRGLGQRLDPVVFIGHQGLTEPVITSLDQALTAHELVKLRVQNNAEDEASWVEQICAQLDCQLVHSIGHVRVFYRAPEDRAEAKIQLLRG